METNAQEAGAFAKAKYRDVLEISRQNVALMRTRNAIVNRHGGARTHAQQDVYNDMRRAEAIHLYLTQHPV